MKYGLLSSFPKTPASKGPRLLSAITNAFREARAGRALMGFSLALMMSVLWSVHPANAQVINYSNGFAGSTGQVSLTPGAVLSGPSIQLTNNSTSGAADNAWYQTPVNVQAFTTTFSFAESCPTDCGDGFGFTTCPAPVSTWRAGT